jgi:hypothetical protein
MKRTGWGFCCGMLRRLSAKEAAEALGLSEANIKTGTA